jgi:REP element-mobilizing transposase RayT
VSRPLRIEFTGAIYHVTSRGDRREPIFEDDEDRRQLLAVLEQGLGRFDAQVLAYCLMGNHYHFVLHTRVPNLSRLMRHLNGVYTQQFNRRHGKVGHLFQGRFKAVLVDRDAYLLEVCRYVELNPVRAGMVAEPGAWPWSSYLAHSGKAPPPGWLDTPGLHGYLLGREARTAAQVRVAGARYAAWVAAGRGLQLWEGALRQQIYLGDEAFVERMQAQAAGAAKASTEVPRRQRVRPQKLAGYLAASPDDRALALRRAYVEGGITMSRIARELGLSVSRVSRLIAGAERSAPRGRGRHGAE